MINGNVDVGSIWKERDSRFNRTIRVLRILNTGHAEIDTVYRENFGSRQWIRLYGTRVTRIKLANFGKRYKLEQEAMDS